MSRPSSEHRWLAAHDSGARPPDVVATIGRLRAEVGPPADPVRARPHLAGDVMVDLADTAIRILGR